MFTKEQHKTIAEILKTCQPEKDKHFIATAKTGQLYVKQRDYPMGINDALMGVAEDLAKYFANDNTTFDQREFLMICHDLSESS